MQIPADAIPLYPRGSEPRPEKLATADDQKPVSVGDPAGIRASLPRPEEKVRTTIGEEEEHRAVRRHHHPDEPRKQERRGEDRRKKNLPILLDTRSGGRRQDASSPPGINTKA